MNGNLKNASSTDVATSTQSDPSKLLSLLTLATGAAALPQSGMADIIYTDLSSQGPPTVGYVGGNLASYLFNDLPGTAQFGLQRLQSTSTTSPGSLTYKFRFVTAGRQGGVATATVRGTFSFGSALVLPLGATWSQGSGGLLSNALLGYGGETGHYPTFGYDNQYLAWAFTDTTAGNAKRYGWIEVSMTIANYPLGPNVTIHGYGYDDTGAKPTMGQMPVPEPSSAGLLVLGALALGSRGLRKWRAARSSDSSS